MRKPRGYTKTVPQNLLRDYRLFAIACEGAKREPAYFKTLGHLSSRIKVDVIDASESIDDAGSLVQENKSSPRWVLDRAVKYIEKEGLLPEDELWFVMDVDRWETAQLREIADFCKTYPNWHIAISNPCFEVWLYCHKQALSKLKKDAQKLDCRFFKQQLPLIEKGGFHPLNFVSDLPTAIQNSKVADIDETHFMPEEASSKVYLLAESLLKMVGTKGFMIFQNHTIPKLKQEMLSTMQIHRRKTIPDSE